MIKSMTGFGRAEAVSRERKVSVETEIRQSQISGSEHQNAEKTQLF